MFRILLEEANGGGGINLGSREIAVPKGEVTF
jgi:hypothetical protein